MPRPVSCTRMKTKSPDSPVFASCPLCKETFLAATDKCPPAGIASRAFTARLINATSNALGSAWTGHVSSETEKST